MKKLKFIAGLMIFTMIILIGCGGVSSTKYNEFLGELPSIIKNYANQLDKKEKELKECTDMNKAFKLQKEIQLFEEKGEKEVSEYVAAHPFNKDLPFKYLPNSKYTVKVIVNRATTSILNLKFLITVNEDMKDKYGRIKTASSIYFKALDSKGSYITRSTAVAATYSNTKLVAGAKYESFGSWIYEATRNMEDFATMVEITEEEYDKNKKK